ncbi:hypothetical protein GCM10023108_41280 [Saccharopolyspora hordei]
MSRSLTLFHSAATPLVGRRSGVAAIHPHPCARKPEALAMQSNSRTIVSVVGTVLMVVTTVLLAAWSPSPAQTQVPVQPAASNAAIEISR